MWVGGWGLGAGSGGGVVVRVGFRINASISRSTATTELVISPTTDAVDYIFDHIVDTERSFQLDFVVHNAKNESAMTTVNSLSAAKTRS